MTAAIIGIYPASTQIGGYRATAAASDHHAVRAAFQSGSDLIADSDAVWPANWLTVLYDQIHPFCVLSARRRGRQPQLWALDQMFCPARNDDRASSILLRDAALIRVLI